ncbi:hypothetical protein D9M68_426540 [compost metagenome]
MRDHGDHGTSEEHRADRQRGDADQMPAQPADGDRPCAVEQQRRQENDEHQIGIHRDRRQARQEGEQCAAGQQCDGRR